MAATDIKLRRINIKKRESKFVDDKVARDLPFCIFIEMVPYVTVMLTSTMLEEFVVGHLITEGIINSLDDIQELRIEARKAYVSLKKQPDYNRLRARKNNILTTACGISENDTELNINPIKSLHIKRIDPKVILDLVFRLNKRSHIFKETGGTHSALLYEHGKDIVAFSEDVGRHNALDKVLGSGYLNDVNLNACILVSSGRLSAEMVLKAIRSEVPVVVSISSPLTSGINIARSAGVTLIGFVRSHRMNIYTHPEKIGNLFIE
jgi:FdhD protein